MNDITLLALCNRKWNSSRICSLQSASPLELHKRSILLGSYHNLTSDILSFSSFDSLFEILEKSKYLNILMIWIIRFVGNLSIRVRISNCSNSSKCWSPIWFRNLVDSIVSSTEKSGNASKECVGRHFVLEAQKVRIWIRSYSGELFLDWKLIQISMNYGGKCDLRN